MTDQRWVIVDQEACFVFGPYNEAELRQAMLDDLILRSGDDEFDTTPEEEAGYRAMSNESLRAEYEESTDGLISEIHEPGADWRQAVAEQQS